jgi:hypothetical protein
MVVESFPPIGGRSWSPSPHQVQQRAVQNGESDLAISGWAIGSLSSRYLLTMAAKDAIAGTESSTYDATPGSVHRQKANRGRASKVLTCALSVRRARGLRRTVESALA